MSGGEPGQHRMVITRMFDAPVERVYSAWTDPEKMVKWLSPNERWLQPALEIENTVGGKHNVIMRHSDGDIFRNVGQYVEIVPNQRISFTWTWANGEMDDGESLVTVDFRPVDGRTELTLTHERLASEDSRNAVSEGWTGCLEQLASHLDSGYQLREAV